MGVDDALARLKKQHVQAGAGVTVAVIDSGVASNVPITSPGRPVETGNKSPSRWTTTAPRWPD
jgi:hypothetical protein